MAWTPLSLQIVRGLKIYRQELVKHCFNTSLAENQVQPILNHYYRYLNLTSTK